MNIFYTISVLFYLNANASGNSISDYFKTFGTLLGYGPTDRDEFSADFYNQKVPYEVATTDQKFIDEAAKLTGIALSELDSCQHRVVLKLQTSCHKLNDERVAKLAVMLLNCQSSIEGRPVYPCTDSMSLRECTTSMDSDTWNSYHLMTNRARAVCYSVRQAQFRGMTELTVNRLLDVAKHQISTLGELNDGQNRLKEVAENTFSSIQAGQNELMRQQRDLRKAQFFGQLVLEDNIKRLGDEKRLITEGHQLLKELTLLTKNAARQLTVQAEERRSNHRELLDDLVAIQNKAHIIFQRLDDSSERLVKQSAAARQQYEATLLQLARVNATVTLLVDVVNGMKRGLDEKLAWLSVALGGTDEALDRVWIAVWHLAFMLSAMLCCSFLYARSSTRLLIVFAVPFNLLASLADVDFALDHNGLLGAIVAFVVAQAVVQFLFPAMHSVKGRLPTSQKKSITSNGSTMPHDQNTDEDDDDEAEDTFNAEISHNFASPSLSNHRVFRETTDEYKSLSRSGTPSRLIHNGSCRARTRAGTPCKITAASGRDFCYRHQSGSSIAA